MSQINRVVTNADLVGAIRQVGISPEFVKIFLPYPDKFRKYAKRIKSTMALLTHSDVGFQGVPELQMMAQEINNAVDLLVSNTVPLDELVLAMKTFYSQDSRSRPEVLAMLSSLQNENEQLQSRLSNAERRAISIEELQSTTRLSRLQLKIDTAINSWSSLTSRRTHRKRTGKTISVSDLLGHIVVSSPSIFEGSKDRIDPKLIGTVVFLTVNERSEILLDDFHKEYPLENSSDKCKADILYQVMMGNTGIDEQREHREPFGTLVGFVDQRLIKEIKETTFPVPFDSITPAVPVKMNCEEFITACNKVLEPIGRFRERNLLEVAKMRESDHELALMVVTNSRLGGANDEYIEYAIIPVAMLLKKEVKDQASVR